MPYGGWRRCARLVGDGVEAIVTLEVGPRIIRFGREQGKNLLVEYPHQLGLTGGAEYRSYGGHRLWVAPEDPEVTYEADNEPVEAEERDGWSWFWAAAGKSGIRRGIGLGFQGPALRVRHVVENQGLAPRELAPWALTVMAPGGECAFPQPEHRPHPEALLPARPLVLWPYTDMADPRWTWGRRAVRLRHDAGGGPQKVGAHVEQGLAAYALSGEVFVKRFTHNPDAAYPDFGCNFETFTRHDMLEVESLGPLCRLAPGESVEHLETWYLHRGSLPTEDDELGEMLDRIAAECPML